MDATEVRRLRDELGMGQEEYAAFLGFSRPTITRWENGSLVPTPQHAELIRLKVAARRAATLDPAAVSA